MQALDPSKATVAPARLREFKGSGARFEPYDTLMARITPCLENGKIARYVPDVEYWGPAFGSTEFIVIRGKENVTDNDFAYYLTRWSEFRSFAIGQMSGSSGRQRVPTKSLAGFKVPLPPLPEQRAIAHILGTLDDKIELNRRMNETLEAMAQAL
ncbi:MAG: restriction endonuclease subunit S, partial [Caldilineae bacterium]